MLAATSVLQQQAAEIRQQRVNWQSYQTYVLSSQLLQLDYKLF